MRGRGGWGGRDGWGGEGRMLEKGGEEGVRRKRLKKRSVEE